MSTGGSIHEQLLCPSCGELVHKLTDKTGWCLSCTRKQSIFTCERCGIDFKSKTRRPYCAYCRDLNWLEAHVEEIEDFMVQGHSFDNAKSRVRENHRPVCYGCGSLMPKVGYFCNTRPECRKLYGRFHKRRLKGMDIETALEQVLNDRRRQS
jgi:predicted amidophosphoribosyltransferase